MTASTILVIEDQVQNQYLMKYLLESHGFHVLLSGDGKAGIDAALAHVPDLILLDIQLPEMNGHDVAKALQANPHLSSIPVVAVTSYAMPGDREQVLASGCTGYIEKPINPETFVSTIKEYLQDTRPADRRDSSTGGCK